MSQQPTRRNDKAVAPITETELDTVRLLAREGNREVIIRRTLGLSPAEWKRARDGEDSPLAEALEYGRAEGLSEVVAFMKRRMLENNSESAATWIANRLYGEKDQDKDNVPRVVINIAAPLSEAEYAATVIEHEP